MTLPLLEKTRILNALKNATERLQAVEQQRSEPLAVIGMSCRFPGAANPDAYWQLLQDGVDATTQIPLDRFDVEQYFDPDTWAPGKMNVRGGGFLEDIDKFDAEFFGISPREAESLDPQQRLLLEAVSEAFEDAGLTREALRDSPSGVFIGITNSDYSRLIARSLSRVDAHFITGNTLNTAAGRISYHFALQGPALIVDTACSSSLAAVHLACNSLRAGECSIAIAAGVNAMLSPDSFIGLAKAGVLASDGRCKPFSAEADGIGRAEGCGAIVLKRLSDAERDGDEILALLRGSALNQDGASGGLTVPCGPAQERVIRRALQNARVNAADIDYVEAHGTGTPLGDPVELRALGNVLGSGRSPDRPLIVGSVKGNIGHGESAAGMAGLIKVILMLRHRSIPPQVNFKQPSPHVDWNALNLSIPTGVRPWTSAEKPRLAGVSGFGFSGTNVHVIVEERVAQQSSSGDHAAPSRSMNTFLLGLSAHSEPALREMASAYARTLANANVRDVCYSAATTRDEHAHRASFISQSREQLIETLDAFSRGQQNAAAHVTSGQPNEVVFLFAGQGVQCLGMGLDLYQQEPVFRSVVDECCTIAGRNLLRPDGLIDDTRHAQPALFVFQYALARLWQSWGVTPSAVIGHSIGEYAAACLAGVMTLEEGLHLVIERGRLMSEAPGNGAMAAVLAPEQRVREHVTFSHQLALAAVNGAENVVLSGDRVALNAALTTLQAHGIVCKPLTVSHAFHSGLMEPVLEPFRSAAANVEFRPPSIPFVSTLTGDFVHHELTSADYWVRQIASTVQLSRGLDTLLESRRSLILEIGPHPILSESRMRVIASCRRGQSESGQMLQALAELHAERSSIDWKAFYSGTGAQRVKLPTYPFQRRRHWFQPAAEDAIPETDCLFEVAWEQQENSAQPHPARWLILADQGGVAEELASALRRSREPHEILHADQPDRDIDHALTRLSQAHLNGPLHIVNLRGLNITADTAWESVQHEWLSAITIVQKLLKLEVPARVWLITRAAQAAGAHEVSILQAPLWGIGRTIALEHPDLFGGLIDLDPGSSDATCILREISNPSCQVAYRNGQRLVPRLQPLRATAASVTIQRTGAYLITGGTGGLGVALARWLIGMGAGHVFLVGRREPGAEVRALLNDQIRFIAADLSDEQAVQRMLQTIDAVAGLGGVFHAAGALDDAMLIHQNEERLATALAGKAWGALHLDRMLRGRRLDCVVYFSSLASVLGSPGQSNYAAANAMLDALAAQRRQQGEAVTSINWGPWREAGMAARGAEEPGALNRRGLCPLSNPQGLRLLHRILNHGSASVTAASINAREMRDSLAGVPLPMLDALAPVDHQPRAARELVDAADFASYLHERAAAILRLQSNQLPSTLSLQQAGLDSMMATELKNRVARELGVDLPIREFLSGASIQELASTLCRIQALSRAQEPAITGSAEMEEVVF